VTVRNPGGQVVHIPWDLHVETKTFCQAHNLRMKRWVSDLVLQAIADGRTTVGEPKKDK
jgi:hypothetical protein